MLMLPQDLMADSSRHNKLDTPAPLFGGRGLVGQILSYRGGVTLLLDIGKREQWESTGKVHPYLGTLENFLELELAVE
jgi:hypothetical protein